MTSGTLFKADLMGAEREGEFESLKRGKEKVEAAALKGPREIQLFPPALFLPHIFQGLVPSACRDLRVVQKSLYYMQYCLAQNRS